LRRGFNRAARRGTVRATHSSGLSFP
jgi:hypothetical protein